MLVGGGVVLAAGAGTFARISRTPQTALLPWEQAGGPQYGDPRMMALSFAVLTPNPHNKQPWLVDLSQSDDTVVLMADLDRLLPETDPFSRQITIGLGGFLELMTMAANAQGYAVETELFPQGFDGAALDQRMVARATFKPDPSVKADPLFEQVLTRRSLKEPYDLNRPVTDKTLSSLIAGAGLKVLPGTSNDMALVQRLRDVTEEALRIELTTPRTWKESVDVMRLGARAVDANPDGIDLTGRFNEAAVAAGLLSERTLLDDTSQAFQGGLDYNHGLCQTSMAFVWLRTSTNTRLDQIATGGDWLRLNLQATALGLGIQPMSQALQEFPEMASLHEEVHQRLAPSGETLQMLGRLGYGPSVNPAPRWPIEAKVI